MIFNKDELLITIHKFIEFVLEISRIDIWKII
jgi:hypothetical protein